MWLQPSGLERVDDPVLTAKQRPKVQHMDHLSLLACRLWPLGVSLKARKDAHHDTVCEAKAEGSVS